MSDERRLQPGELGYRHQCAVDYCTIKDEFSDLRNVIAEAVGHGADQGIGWIDEKIITTINAISDRIEDQLGVRL